MKACRTAELTAVWRRMGGVENDSIKYTTIPMRAIGYMLGMLDPNSVKTICHRTVLIDSLIKKINPKNIVEIGAGYSCRAKRFPDMNFYELDMPCMRQRKNQITSFEIGKDELELDIKSGLFIIEGVSMYLKKPQLTNLLKQIRKYDGHIIIDFFSKEFSSPKKTLREKIYKMLFSCMVGSDRIFEYRIENTQEGKMILQELGYKDAKFYRYEIPKTLDVLFSAKI